MSQGSPPRMKIAGLFSREYPTVKRDFCQVEKLFLRWGLSLMLTDTDKLCLVNKAVGRGTDFALIDQLVQSAAGNPQLAGSVSFGERGQACSLPRVALCWPLIRGDKRIAAAVFERRDVYLQGQVPRFPAKHLPNELHDCGMAGLAGHARVKAGQHRRGGARLSLQEEQPAGGREMRRIPVESSAYVVFHSPLLTVPVGGSGPMTGACGFRERELGHR
jgi:hypothetical protein